MRYIDKPLTSPARQLLEDQREWMRREGLDEKYGNLGSIVNAEGQNESVKKILNHQLRHEQGRICCYCQQRILQHNGERQSDGTTFTDILVAPVNYIKPFISEFLKNLNESNALKMFPADEYCILAFDRKLLKQNIFAYLILSDLEDRKACKEIRPEDVIIATLKYNKDMPFYDEEEEVITNSIFNESIQSTVKNMMSLVNSNLVSRAKTFGYTYVPERSSISSLVFLNDKTIY